MSNIQIASLNLGYNIMANVIAGSEAKFVNICQTAYPKNNGWFNSEKKISRCSFNAAKFLSDYDLFGTQEVNHKYKDKFFDIVKKSTMDKNFKFIQTLYHAHTYIVTGYDYDKLGKGQLILERDLSSKTDTRAMQFVWFNKIGLLFINLHAPHGINLKYEIEKICSNIYLNVFPEKIIMVGDFNDASAQLLLSSINIFNIIIKLPIYSFIPKTCCTDVGYKYSGDYILTSDYSNKKLYFGLPLKYDRQTNLFSDHDPVVLLS